MPFPLKIQQIYFLIYESTTFIYHKIYFFKIKGLRALKKTCVYFHTQSQLYHSLLTHSSLSRFPKLLFLVYILLEKFWQGIKYFKRECLIRYFRKGWEISRGDQNPFVERFFLFTWIEIFYGEMRDAIL